MTEHARLGDLLRRGHVNAALSWGLTGLVGLVAAGSLLTGQFLWAGFTAGVVALALAPPVGHRDPLVTVPWEVLAIGALPVFAHAVAQFPITSRLTAHLSVAALALLLAVELEVFTPVRMADWFAVLFVVVATMATAGTWTLVQWLSDVYLGTAYLLTGAPEAVVERAVMWDFVAATAAGVGAGLVFELYFRRRAAAVRRLPGDVGEPVE